MVVVSGVWPCDQLGVRFGEGALQTVQQPADKSTLPQIHPRLVWE